MFPWIFRLSTTPPSMSYPSTPADLTDIDFETLCIANEFTYSILSNAFYYLVFLYLFFFANSRPNDTTLLLTTTLYKSLRYPTLVLYIHVSFSHFCNEFPSSLWASSSGVNVYLSYASFFATSSIIIAFLGPSFWALLEREKRPFGQRRRQHQNVESLRGGCELTLCSVLD